MSPAGRPVRLGHRPVRRPHCQRLQRLVPGGSYARLPPSRAAAVGRGLSTRCTVLWGLSAVQLGAALLVVVGLTVAIGLLLRDDRLTILLAFAVVAFAFYAVPTRVHERYLFAALPGRRAARLQLCRRPRRVCGDGGAQRPQPARGVGQRSSDRRAARRRVWRRGQRRRRVWAAWGAVPAGLAARAGRQVESGRAWAQEPSAQVSAEADWGAGPARSAAAGSAVAQGRPLRSTCRSWTWLEVNPSWRRSPSVRRSRSSPCSRSGSRSPSGLRRGRDGGAWGCDPGVESWSRTPHRAPRKTESAPGLRRGSPDRLGRSRPHEPPRLLPAGSAGRASILPPDRLGRASTQAPPRLCP
jgi:hypothetical protein